MKFCSVWVKITNDLNLQSCILYEILFCMSEDCKWLSSEWVKYCTVIWHKGPEEMFPIEFSTSCDSTSKDHNLIFNILDIEFLHIGEYTFTIVFVMYVFSSCCTQTIPSLYWLYIYHNPLILELPILYHFFPNFINLCVISLIFLSSSNHCL